MENIINIQNLTKYYGKHRGIEDLSLSVRKGEIFGFIGPNGSRKKYDDSSNDGAFDSNGRKGGNIRAFGAGT